MISRIASSAAAPASRALARPMSTTPNMFADLAGKVVVVGGAGNPAHEEPGIGATTSMMFAKYGCKVISVAGGDGHAYVADCTNPAEIEALKDHVLKEFG